MADGRLFTDYRPRCDINYWRPAEQREQLIGARAPADSYAYRQYMIANADKLMADQRRTAYSAASCAPCAAPFDQPGTMLGEKDMEVCDARSCRRVPGPDPINGMGTGRDYGIDPASRARLAEMHARQTKTVKDSANCCATPYDTASYYPIQGSFGSLGADPGMRLTSPGGASSMPLEGGDPSAR